MYRVNPMAKFTPYQKTISKLLWNQVPESNNVQLSLSCQIISFKCSENGFADSTRT